MEHVFPNVLLDISETLPTIFVKFAIQLAMHALGLQDLTALIAQ